MITLQDLEMPINIALSNRLANQLEARPRECFTNAIKGAFALSQQDPYASVYYAEGYAVDLTLGALPIEHAWIVVNGEIVEVTPRWRESAIMGNALYLPTVAYVGSALLELLAYAKWLTPLFYRLPDNLSDRHYEGLKMLMSLLNAS